MRCYESNEQRGQHFTIDRCPNKIYKHLGGEPRKALVASSKPAPGQASWARCHDCKGIIHTAIVWDAARYPSIISAVPYTDSYSKTGGVAQLQLLDLVSAES
jgi:hypothetical protein